MRQEIWLVWLGEYEPELIAARTSRESAVKWCNEHRKLSGGDPVTWNGDSGTSRFRVSAPMHDVTPSGKLSKVNRKISGTFVYTLEKFLLED